METAGRPLRRTTHPGFGTASVQDSPVFESMDLRRGKRCDFQGCPVFADRDLDHSALKTASEPTCPLRVSGDLQKWTTLATSPKLDGRGSPSLHKKTGSASLERLAQRKGQETTDRQDISSGSDPPPLNVRIKSHEDHQSLNPDGVGFRA